MSNRSIAAGTSEGRLVEQVRELREEVRRLTLRLDRQEDLIQDLTAQILTQEESSVAGESVGYSLVTEPLAGQLSAPSGDLSWEFREQVAEELGDFLRRALGGSHRGKSGRGKVNLPSRFYIILRDFAGLETLHPARVFTNYSRVKALCSRGNSFGNSVFIGVPTEREARIVVRRAGGTWPDQLQ